jgi:hypothetical protein
LRGRAALLEAGIHFRAGELAETRAALGRALAAATADADQRFATACLRALDDSASTATLGRVLFGDERGRPLDPGLTVYLLTEFARQEPEDALGPYLIGRQLAQRDSALALAPLQRACPTGTPPLPEPLDATLFKECQRLLGATAYRAGDLATARAAFAWLATHGDCEADRLRARDYLERVAWKSDAPMLQPSAGSGGTKTPHDRSQVPAR